MTIRAITLDLDDTLWPVAPTIMRAERKAHAWLEERFPDVTERWTTDRLRARRMEIHASRADLRHDLLHIRRIALQEAFLDCRIVEEAAREAIEMALELFMVGRNEVEFYPEVLEVLERLADRYAIASLSNGNADLTQIGLDHLFTAKVAAHTHGTSKPDRVIFHAACRALDCDPVEVVHVGDDPDMDVRGARAAGLHAVWINRDEKLWVGDDMPVIVTDLEALERWLERQ